MIKVKILISLFIVFVHLFVCCRDDSSTLQTREKKIYEGDICLMSQHDVDAFGALDYAEINGEVCIKSLNSDITDLYPLFSITIIAQRLIIEENDSLISLDGLNNLTSVAGLTITCNDALKDISALSNIPSTGLIDISDNISLASLEGLHNISTIYEQGYRCVFIRNNDALTNVDGLRGLENFTTILELSDNYSLSNLDGLSNLTYLDHLRINNNYSLIDLNGLIGISAIGSELLIIYNNSLSNIDGLSNLNSIEGDLAIWDNDSLTNIEGLSKTTEIGYISIFHNDSLKNIDGLNDVKCVKENVDFTWNEILSDFCGLKNLFTNGDIGGDYTVCMNAYNPTPKDIISGNCSQ